MTIWLCKKNNFHCICTLWHYYLLLNVWRDWVVIWGPKKKQVLLLQEAGTEITLCGLGEENLPNAKPSWGGIPRDSMHIAPSNTLHKKRPSSHLRRKRLQAKGRKCSGTGSFPVLDQREDRKYVQCSLQSRGNMSLHLILEVLWGGGGWRGYSTNVSMWVWDICSIEVH